MSCEVLEVSASGYFNWLRRRESGHGGSARRHRDEALLAHIRAIHAEVKGEYGWPRMHKELLAQMDLVVPWAALVELITPYYPEGKNGRPPFALETMLRIQFAAWSGDRRLW